VAITKQWTVHDSSAMRRQRHNRKRGGTMAGTTTHRTGVSRTLWWTKHSAAKLKTERISPRTLPRAKKSTNGDGFSPRWWCNFFGLGHRWQLLPVLLRLQNLVAKLPCALLELLIPSISLERQWKITCIDLLRVLGLSLLQIKI
jgi:hypothetical protein